MTKKKPPAKRAAVPPPEAVVEKLEFVSPKGNRYTILRTNEVDGYEEPPKRPRSRRRPRG